MFSDSTSAGMYELIPAAERELGLYQSMPWSFYQCPCWVFSERCLSNLAFLSSILRWSWQLPEWKAWATQFMTKSQSAPTRTLGTPRRAGITIYASGSSKALCSSSSCTLHKDNGGSRMPQESGRAAKTATFTREQHVSYALQGLQVSSMAAIRRVNRLPTQLLFYIAWWNARPLPALRSQWVWCHKKAEEKIDSLFWSAQNMRQV